MYPAGKREGIPLAARVILGALIAIAVTRMAYSGEEPRLESTEKQPTSTASSAD